MLPADVHVRFRRMQGNEVLFICATDEHGTPAELAALASGQTPLEYCNEQHLVQKRLAESFMLSFDYFGRSSSPENHLLTQHFADKLEDNGFIEERAARQIYSIDDNRFLPDRYVEGECPRCGYNSARGDQCDRCDALLDPVDLINPRSTVSGSTNLEIRETRHLYLRQSLMPDRLRAWIDSQTAWPHLARSIGYKWLEEGLKDRAITRDLSWGVPVTRHGITRPGFENKVFYVWFDAPIAYISATQEWAKATGNDWAPWWRTDHQNGHDVRYVQFMGKDNVAFHTVSFPATIFGSAEPWKTVDELKAFSWLNWYGSKFSTSRKRGVFMDQALDLLPTDYWRWYLIAHAPENSDSTFTWEQFQASINKDLSDVLGNFVNRVMSFCTHNFDGRVPDGGSPGDGELRLFAEVDTRLKALTEFHEHMEFRKAASETRAIWSTANEYLSIAAPWKAIKVDRDRAAMNIRLSLNLCRLMALIGYPIIPGTATTILASLGCDHEPITWPQGHAAENLSVLPCGRQISQPPILFRKVETCEIADWTLRFGGATQNL
jgi:methionyl-tRNA synthetase